MHHSTLGYYLDKLVCTHVSVQRRFISAFQLSGAIGLALAIALSMALVTARSLSPWVMIAITATALSTFFALALLTKMITGTERLIYYHHEIAVLAMTALLLIVLRQPILPYLDITVLGVGVFLACGRVGCFMAGCCHGRPHAWGVCYRAEHAAAGFPAYFVGVRLFPIQLVESLWAWSIVIAGSVLVLGGSQPGTALATYLVVYGIGRFCFEFLRGDPDRPYRGGFSAAQWTSVLLAAMVVLVEVSDLLPRHAWQLVLALGLIVAPIGIMLRRRWQGDQQVQLLQPRHIHEIVDAVADAAAQAVEKPLDVRKNGHPADVHIAQTSLGLQISASRFQSADETIFHYAVSSCEAPLKPSTARALVTLIRQLRHAHASSELIDTRHGVFHLLIHSVARSDERTPCRA